MTPSGSILGKPDKPGGAYGGPDKPPAKKKRRKPEIGKPATYTPGKTVDPRKKPEDPPDSDIPKHEHAVSPVVAAAERYLKRKAK